MDNTKKYIIASFTSYSIFYPLSVIKFNKQVYNISYNQLIKKFVCINGYRGFGFSLFTYPLFWSSYFITSNYLNSYYSNIILIPFISGAIGSLITNPFYYYNQYYCTNSNINSYLYVIKKCSRYPLRGYGFTLLNNSKLCIIMPLSDYLCQYNIIIGSFSAKFIGTTIFYPFDTLRTIVRSKTSLKDLDYKKVFNFKNFYRGTSINILCTYPQFILMNYIIRKLAAFGFTL